MKKILFLHGFFATGSCPLARAQKILMEYSMKEERFFRHLASPSSSSLGKT